MWPSSNKFGSSHRLQIVHSTQGPTRGARAQQNERTDVLLSNGSIASDPSIAPEPAAPSYYLLSDALPPLLHQLLTCAHTACLLEARSTHVEFGQGAQVAHVHYILSLHTFLAGITHPSCIALPPVHPLRAEAPRTQHMPTQVGMEERKPNGSAHHRRSVSLDHRKPPGHVQGSAITRCCSPARCLPEPPRHHSSKSLRATARFHTERAP